jgi:1,2-dihydroxy-3-keto-5-methylthiopentene dioxygenase
VAQVSYRDQTFIDKDLDEIFPRIGILYQQWDIARLPARLAQATTLDDMQKAEIVSLYQAELDSLKSQRGYLAEDIIILTPQTANLDELLKMFKKEHHHSDDEVRFCVAGEGVFTVKSPAGDFADILMKPGDLIVVPAGVRHWFGLTETQQIIAARVFKTTSGWKAIY